MKETEAPQPQEVPRRSNLLLTRIEAFPSQLSTHQGHSLPSADITGNTGGSFKEKAALAKSHRTGKHIQSSSTLGCALGVSGKGLQSCWQNREVMERQPRREREGIAVSSEPGLDFGSGRNNWDGGRAQQTPAGSVLGRGQSVGRAGDSGPGQGKPRRESPAPRVFCNPLEHLLPSSTGVSASWGWRGRATSPL